LICAHVQTPGNAGDIFNAIDRDRGITILGINDDIESGYDEVVEKMAKWFDSRWPDKALWERS
jgi:3-O-alpha-D-mannopyranosyl-alpha-D-mannopyranose xylosylphosphotransferase